MGLINLKGHFLFLTILTLFYILSTIFVASYYPIEFDEGNLTAGVINYNYKKSQPHLPGYFLFIIFAKGINFVLNNPYLSTRLISAFFGLSCLYFFYFFSLKLFLNKLHAFLITFCFATLPVFIFYKTLGLTYTIDAFAVILLGFLAYQIIIEKKKYEYFATLSFGILIGFRQSISLFLLPLWLFGLFNTKKKIISLILNFLLLIFVILLWLLPQVHLTQEGKGLTEYFKMTQSVFLLASKDTSIFLGANKIQLLNQIKLFLQFLVGEVGFYIIFLFIALLAKKINIKNFLIFVFPILPSIIFYLFIHLGQPGYLLIFIPILVLFSGFVLKIPFFKKFFLLLFLALAIFQLYIFIIPIKIDRIDQRFRGFLNPVNLVKMYFYVNARFSYFKIKDNNQFYTGLKNYLSQFDPEKTIIFAPSRTFYVENKIRTRNPDLYRQLMVVFPQYYVYEPNHSSNYHIIEKDYTTKYFYEKTIKFPKQIKTLILVVNDLFENEWPKNLVFQKINLDNQNLIFYSNLDKINQFDFLGHTYKRDEKFKF